MRQLFTTFLLTLAAIVFAQKSPPPNSCLPASPVSADWPVSAAALQKLFEDAAQKGELTKAELTPEAYENLKTQINRCNNEMEVALSGIHSQMSDLSLKYMQILGYKDIAGIEKQLRDLEESRKNSKDELEKYLNSVKHSGIFVVLLENVDFFKNEKKDLISAAGQSVTARAVEDLVGVNIRRSAEVRDFAPVRDVVQEIKNGEVRVEREYFNQSYHSKKQFLFVARFGATPARQKPAGASPAPANALVLNLSLDADFRRRLAEKGVLDADIRRIEQEVAPFLPNVQRDNKTADDRQDYILQNGAEQIRRTERDIEDARLRLQTRSAKIGDICRELGVPFNKTDFGSSVNAALQKIKDQLRDLTAQWNRTAEREVLYKDTRTFAEGSLSQSLAAEAVKLGGQIEEGFGKLDNILQVTEVENYDLTKFENSRTVTVYRAPQKIWVYFIPRDGDAYGVAVMAQFKVTGSTVGNVANTIKPQKPGVLLRYEPEMVKVEGGEFEMGCTYEQGSDCESDEKPAHKVQLRSYYISQTEITNEQFLPFLNDIAPKITFYVGDKEVKHNGQVIVVLSDRFTYNATTAGVTFSVAPGYEKHPVINVSCNAAQEYLKWLSEKTKKKYRLPTEAEWEYAARGGHKIPKAPFRPTKFAGSNSVDEVAWHYQNSGGKTHPVGLKKTNELGLFDMSGNVWEWCSDWYAETYPSAAQTNPVGPASGTYRVCRGGSWLNCFRALPRG